MSEVSPTPVGGITSAGALLREARERAGMHIGALAVGLKVPVKKIEALEADRLDLLPDAVFARALASSIARTLKTDPAAILAALPQGLTPGLEVGRSVSRIGPAPLTIPALGTVQNILRKPAVLMGGLLVVGALALVFVPMSDPPPPGRTLSLPPSMPNSPTQSGLDTAEISAKIFSSESSVVIQGQSNPSQASHAATTTAPSAASPSLPPTLPASGKTLETAMVLGSGAEVQAKPGNTGLIQLNASGMTWVEVTDAAGVVQLRKTLVAGENASAGGVLPLRVIVGKVDATQVHVRGKPFDIAPLGKDNVARFEVR